jgi:DNA-binding transcriptional LysR family regulator
MTPELRHLRYFVAVAEELHFGRAADRAGIAQPALSQQVRRLEGMVGAELFVRSTRSVALTPAGAALLPHARRALAEAELGAAAAARAARGEIGHLTVGFIETAAVSLIPAAVREFRARHPDVTLSLRELSVDAQIQGLRGGTLDLGVVRAPVDAADLEVAVVADDRLLAAVPGSHRLAAAGSVSVPELAAEPLVALSREVVPGLHDQVISLFSEHGHSARITQEATSIQAVMGLVAAGLGIALLPSSVRSLSREGIAFVDLDSSEVSLILAVHRGDESSPLVEAFLAAARSGSADAAAPA